MYLTENLKFHLAENLKFLREQNGKTQGELAVLFGIEQKTMWQTEARSIMRAEKKNMHNA